MLNKIRERGWMILNGSFEKEGGWTYIGELGTSVIDYVVSNEKAFEEVKKVEEDNKTVRPCTGGSGIGRKRKEKDEKE